MKTIWMILLLFLPCALMAQVQIQKKSLAPIGGYGTSGNIHLLYVGAEIANRETDVAGTHLSEGFIGPDLAHIMGIEDYQRMEGVHIFPNPVRDNLQILLPAYGTYEIYIYNENGQEVWRRHFTGSRNIVPMREYATGTYILLIIDREHQTYTSIKIQKTF